MMVVGLTGGIGSGKSTVAKIFNHLGISIYDSDTRAKDLYTESVELKQKMQVHFGTSIYGSHGINKSKLALIVFNDKAQLEVLNGLVHPLLQADFDAWKVKQKGAYVIREAAILIESGAYKSCDKVVVVSAVEVVRITRVVKRDKVSTQQVMERISNQIPDAERLDFADFEIKNNGVESLIEQVLKIDSELRNR